MRFEAESYSSLEPAQLVPLCRHKSLRIVDCTVYYRSVEQENAHLLFLWVRGWQVSFEARSSLLKQNVTSLGHYSRLIAMLVPRQQVDAQLDTSSSALSLFVSNCSAEHRIHTLLEALPLSRWGLGDDREVLVDEFLAL